MSYALKICWSTAVGIGADPTPAPAARPAARHAATAIIPAVKPTVAILCGGRGARLQEHTQAVPKPLVEVGGRPIVWHVIQIFIAQGFTRFCLLTGYRGEQVEAFARAEEWPDG